MRVLRVRETPPAYQFAVPMIDSGYKSGSSPVLSPDGRTLYFQAASATSKFTGGGETANFAEVFRRRLDEPSATLIEGTEGVTGFTVSPDGRNLILKFPGAILKKVGVEGGSAQQLTDRAVGGGLAPAVAPDGTVIVGFGSAPIRRLLTDGRFEDVTQLDKEQGEKAHQSPVFLSDGKRFLFVAVSWDATNGTIRRVLCAATLGSKTVTRIGEVPTNVQFNLGHVFYVRDGTLMAQPFSESQLKFTGDAVAVASGVAFSSRTGQVSFSVASNGTIAYQPFASSNRLTWVDGSGKQLGNIGSIAAINRGLALLPHADRVIVPVRDHRAGNSSLWIQDLTRATATRVTFSAAEETFPVTTPDGTRVFFGSDFEGFGLHIYEAPLDGSAQPSLVVSAPGNQTPNDVSADGKWLLFQTNQNQAATKQDLWVLPLEGERKPRPFLATPNTEFLGSFSPDSKWVTYLSNAAGSIQVYVRPFPGPGPARLVSTKEGSSPRFSRDGHRIYFADVNKLMAANFHPDGTVDEPVVAFELDERIQAFQQMPTADRFVMVLQNDAEASPPVRIITGWRPPA
jgi:Tol biopolymer transport system component